MMEAFTIATGIAVPMLQPNIDTDQLAPGTAILNLEKAGSGHSLFSNLRYTADGSENPEFILNQAPFREASFIIAGANFGCGSSREIAVWALRDFGIRAVVAPSFGAIFANNCYINGVLPITLSSDCVTALASELTPVAAEITIDLRDGQISAPSGRVYRFQFPHLQRLMLLEGLDAIGLTLKHEKQITDFQAADIQDRPWIYRG